VGKLLCTKNEGRQLPDPRGVAMFEISSPLPRNPVYVFISRPRQQPVTAIAVLPLARPSFDDACTTCTTPFVTFCIQSSTPSNRVVSRMDVCNVKNMYCTYNNRAGISSSERKKIPKFRMIFINARFWKVACTTYRTVPPHRADRNSLAHSFTAVYIHCE